MSALLGRVVWEASFTSLYLLLSGRDGYNAWRDCLKPAELLSKLCRENSVDGPHFSPGRITVADKVFTGKTLFMDEGTHCTHYITLFRCLKPNASVQTVTTSGMLQTS